MRNISLAILKRFADFRENLSRRTSSLRCFPTLQTMRRLPAFKMFHLKNFLSSCIWKSNLKWGTKKQFSKPLSSVTFAFHWNVVFRLCSDSNCCQCSSRKLGWSSHWKREKTKQSSHSLLWNLSWTPNHLIWWCSTSEASRLSYWF